MTVKRKDLENFVNKTLNIWDFSDYGPNGLQIEGKKEIAKIAFAVSATKNSIAKAVAENADAMFVHHGLFWKFHGAKCITKAFAKRVKPLIQDEINLFGYHLPLDAHLELGNAASLGKRIELEDFKPFGDYKGCPTGIKGLLKTPLYANELQDKLQEVLDHPVLMATEDNKKIKSVGIITGGANGDWLLAHREGLDAYITGEMSEHDWHESQEAGVCMYAGGHNATEQFGIQSLQSYIQKKFEVETFFISSENPA